jgi:hypothetical protein
MILFFITFCLLFFICTKQLIDFFGLLTLLQDSKQLTVTNMRTLKMTEDVLAVSIGPQGKHIAVALLDCNVKVWFLYVTGNLELYYHLESL